MTEHAISPQDTIWVGVDGSAASDAAVRFAAHEARVLDLGLHLLHVIPINMTMSPMFPIVPEDMEPVGRRMLKEAEQIAAETVPAHRITSSLHHGQRASSLVEASRRARVLVLGGARRSTAARLLTGSVASAVSARSDGSVLVVPAGWEVGEGQFHVVVGLKDPEQSSDLALRALRLAADHGGRVTFVHAWDLPSPYDDLISARVDDREWTRRGRDAVDTALRDALALYDEVPVEVRIVHGQAARVLHDEASTADLLLLARRGSVFPRGHLGGTARALLREGACPIGVVPPADGTPDTADVVEEETVAGFGGPGGRGVPLPA